MDSTAAYEIVNYLSSVAVNLNIAVIMTIHQPSAIVFDMLDDLLLMESGRTVFNGTIKDAPQYFASIGYLNSDDINPADYYLELAQKPIEGEEGASWSSKFAATTEFLCA